MTGHPPHLETPATSSGGMSGGEGDAYTCLCRSAMSCAGSLFYGPLRGVEKGDKVLHGVYRDELGAKRPPSAS